MRNTLDLIAELSLDNYIHRSFPYWLLKIPSNELVWVMTCDESLEDSEANKLIRVYRKVKVLEAA